MCALKDHTRCGQRNHYCLINDFTRKYFWIDHLHFLLFFSFSENKIYFMQPQYPNRGYRQRQKTCVAATYRKLPDSPVSPSLVGCSWDEGCFVLVGWGYVFRDFSPQILHQTNCGISKRLISIEWYLILH